MARSASLGPSPTVTTWMVGLLKAIIGCDRRLVPGLIGAWALLGGFGPVAAVAATETPILDFDGANGASPEGRLVSDSAGNLYGTTTAGGAQDSGTVFRLSPPGAGQKAWTETILHSFCISTGCGDGTIPLAGLTHDGAGGFFGVTSSGGPTNWGTVFRLRPPASGKTTWVYSVLHNFCAQSTSIRTCLDGGAPAGDLLPGPSGILYGTVSAGGLNSWGAVFALTPPASGKSDWTYEIIHNFDFYDGARPLTGLIIGAEGVLYGTTSSAGASGYGSAYSLAPPVSVGQPWTFGVIHQFCAQSECVDGGSPYGELAYLPGQGLYGTTSAGGPYNSGVVYRLTAPAKGKSAWTYTIIHPFHYSDGSGSLAGPVFDSAGTLYGSTGSAGGYGYGTIFSLVPPKVSGGAWTETILHSFSGGSDGEQPQGTLLLTSSGSLWGIATAGGGAADVGQVFGIKP